MPLYIRYTDNGNGQVIEIEYIMRWNLGQHIFQNPFPKINPLNIIEIEASGEELLRITHLLKGIIRPPKYEKIIWEDNLARIIWAIIEDIEAKEYYNYGNGWMIEKPQKTLKELGRGFERRDLPRKPYV